MRCCILYNQPGENALADELDVLDQVEFIEKNLHKLGIDTFRKGITIRFMDEVTELSADRPDFVFNLVESINNKGELSYFIPALLNMYSIPYSGNPLEAIFTTTNKTLARRMMHEAGINIPESYFPSQYKSLKPGRRYIVKPIWEDGSLGISANSVFECKPGYEKNLKSLADSHWFIEDYIDGREFNLSMLAGKSGPEVLPTAEIVFKNFDHTRPKIIDFKAKWEIESFEYINTVREFPGSNLDSKLKKKLTGTALKCWQAFGLKGYARADMRTDKNNDVYVLEVNANPCISPDGGFVAATAEAQLSFTTVLNRIINDLNN